MMNLTAIIRCKPESADAVLRALVAVGDYVRANEPGTLGYRVVRSTDDPEVLITQERFADRAAMDAHDDGAGSKAFFAAAQDWITAVEVHVGDEVYPLERSQG